MTLLQGLFNLLLRFIGGLLGLALIFAILNGVLYGLQEIYHYSDVKKCENMEKELESIKEQVEYYEHIGAMQGGLDKRDYYEYSHLIEKHNALVAEYNELASSAYSRFWLLPFPAPSRHH